MKDLTKCTMTILVVTMLIAALPTDAEGMIYEDTIRLHILANSDSAEDQALKIRIRDRLLEKYGVMLSEGGSIDEAKDKICNLLPEIEADVSKWIADEGYNYSAHAIIGQEWYETREYEGFSLPAGFYCSLRIIIGDGDGQNWWCVMYPPLCLEMATESAPADEAVINYTKADNMLIDSGKYRVKFKILEDLSRVFAKNG